MAHPVVIEEGKLSPLFVVLVPVRVPAPVLVPVRVCRCVCVVPVRVCGCWRGPA